MAAVYSREIDGQVLTLVPSGWTYRNIFVLYDRETNTLWYPSRNGLRGIQGKYFGRELEKLPSKDTTWNKWMNKNLGSKILR
ncbi:MAG: DUF3179 domain-containing (seleno)protein [bacterium]|nr:DUF3179 domain-containing (seleno)protein [bacterium]